MTLDDLGVFITVYETGNLSGVARTRAVAAHGCPA